MESVNMVNAAAVASANGIAVSTVRHDRQCDYETLLRVTINHASGTRTIAGTLVGGDKARIVEVQHIAVESDFPPYLLYLRNYDKPGFIGDLGSLCSKHGINISQHGVPTSHRASGAPHGRRRVARLVRKAALEPAPVPPTGTYGLVAVLLVDVEVFRVVRVPSPPL